MLGNQPGQGFRDGAALTSTVGSLPEYWRRGVGMLIFVILVEDAGMSPGFNATPNCRNVACYVSACATSIFSSTSLLSPSRCPSVRMNS